jgi:hypothetical protein
VDGVDGELVPGVDGAGAGALPGLSAELPPEPQDAKNTKARAKIAIIAFFIGKHSFHQRS